MRIILINSIRSYGGGEKRLLRNAEEFRRRGHDILVLARPGAELLRRCGEQGLATAEAPMRHYASPASVLALRREIGRFGADAALTYDERSVRTAALALRFSRPALVHYYGLEGAFKDKPFNRYVVAPRVDCFVSNAHAIEEELRSFGWIPDERLRVIYDGVDPAPIDQADPAGIREDLGIAPDQLLALVVARLVPEKGHAFLLEVLANAAPAHPELRVCFVGEGPEADAIRRRIKELGLLEGVRLLGFRSDVPRLLRAADLLIHPSRREGAPNAVREAMAAGLPVVAVAASGTPELMVDGETGLLSAIGDAEGLRTNLERVFSDPDMRRRMGAAGRRRALSEFSEERCTDLWLDVLEEVRRTRNSKATGHG